MKIDWSALRTELSVWKAQGRVLPFWWRDDDAIEVTLELEQLSELAENVSVPVHLAVIPRDASAQLGEHIAASQSLIPVVHGWGHINHQAQASANSGQETPRIRPSANMKSAEFGASRSLADKEADILRAFEKIHDLAGNKMAPMFVPPWNRIDPAIFPSLVRVGYTAISTYQPRPKAQPVPGLEQINTHLDPIFWRGTRGLVDPDTLVSFTIQNLQDRRNGTTDIREPFGFLTHHLVHNGDIWEFSRQFLNEMCDGPVRLYRHDRKV